MFLLVRKDKKTTTDKSLRVLTSISYDTKTSRGGREAMFLLVRKDKKTTTDKSLRTLTSISYDTKTMARDILVLLLKRDLLVLG